MNAKVTGMMIPVSTSSRPRSSRRGVLGFPHIHVFMMTSRTRDTRPNHTTMGLALLSSLTLEIRSNLWVPAGHPQYTCAWFAREAVDGPTSPQTASDRTRALRRLRTTLTRESGVTNTDNIGCRSEGGQFWLKIHRHSNKKWTARVNGMMTFQQTPRQHDPVNPQSHLNKTTNQEGG